MILKEKWYDQKEWELYLLGFSSLWIQKSEVGTQHPDDVGNPSKKIEGGVGYAVVNEMGYLVQ